MIKKKSLVGGVVLGILFAIAAGAAGAAGAMVYLQQTGAAQDTAPSTVAHVVTDGDGVDRGDPAYVLAEDPATSPLTWFPNRTVGCEYNQTFSGEDRADVYVCDDLPRPDSNHSVAGLAVGDAVWVHENWTTPTVLTHELAHTIDIGHAEMVPPDRECTRSWQFHATADRYENISIESRNSCEVLETPFGTYPKGG